MAKKAAKEEVKPKADSYKTATDFLSTPKEILHISPAFDVGLGGGIPLGSWVILTGKFKSGKEQPISSTIYTINGPVKMGDVKIGDMVCTPDGKSAKIINIYPQGEKDVYRITFNDNTEVKCGIDHLWKVRKNNSRFDYQVLSLREILKQGYKYCNRNKFMIQLTEPVMFTKKSLPIDPYILGCLIGDGSLRDSVKISSADEFILNKFRKYAKQCGLELKRRSKYDYCISSGNNGGKPNVVKNLLIDLKLFGHKSHTKFIPEIYKYSSIEDRYAIIRGLMDTDGYNSKRCHAEYSTTSYQLALDVREILNSLGFLAKIKYRTTKCNNKEFPSYRLYITGQNVDSLFSLPRKLGGKIRSKPPLHRSIKKIEYIGREESQCIEIDHKDHLYLTDNYTITHNTTTAMHMIARFLQQFENSQALFVDVESRLKEQTLSNIFLDKDRLQILTSSEDEILHAEQLLERTESWVKSNKKSIVVIDSTSAMCSQKEYVDPISGNIRSLGPKLMATFTRKMAPIVPIQNCIMILITHLIANTSGYGSPFTEDSGNKIQYQSDVKLRCRRNEDWLINDKLMGQKNEWSVEWSAIGPPGATINSYLQYNYGLDDTMEIVDLAIQLGLVAKAGAWFTVGDLKVQGMNGVYDLFQNDVELRQNTLKEIHEILL